MRVFWIACAVLAALPVTGQEVDPRVEAGEFCATIPDDQVRLYCFDKAFSGAFDPALDDGSPTDQTAPVEEGTDPAG